MVCWSLEALAKRNRSAGREGCPVKNMEPNFLVMVGMVGVGCCAWYAAL